jgi:hypothetical protein
MDKYTCTITCKELEGKKMSKKPRKSKKLGKIKPTSKKPRKSKKLCKSKSKRSGKSKYRNSRK